MSVKLFLCLPKNLNKKGVISRRFPSLNFLDKSHTAVFFLRLSKKKKKILGLLFFKTLVDNILSNPNIKILSNIKSQIYVKLFLKVKIALF